MNIVNSMIGILLLAMLILIGYKVSQLVIEINSPIVLKTNTAQFTVPETPSPSSNLRWNHFPLTVYMNDNFIRQSNPSYVDDVKKALNIWQAKGIVSFSVTNSQDADITIEWVPILKEKASDTLGDTGIKFVNVSQFGVIQNAKIELLTKSDSHQLSSTDMTNLALHEIGHAIGLQHTNEDDIMNPVLILPTREIKIVSARDISVLQKLYELSPKPNLKITGINATKWTFTRFGHDYYYLNVSISIQNVGLSDAQNFTLQINADSSVVNEENIQKLEVGNTLSIFEGNLKIDGNFTSVQAIVDLQNVVDELDETDNSIEVTV